MGFDRTLSYALALAIAALAVPATAQTAQELEGLWRARLRLGGPDVRGEVIVTRRNGGQAPAKEPANEARGNRVKPNPIISVGE